MIWSSNLAQVSVSCYIVSKSEGPPCAHVSIVRLLSTLAEKAAVCSCTCSQSTALLYRATLSGVSHWIEPAAALPGHMHCCILLLSRDQPSSHKWARTIMCHWTLNPHPIRNPNRVPNPTPT